MDIPTSAYILMPLLGYKLFLEIATQTKKDFQKAEVVSFAWIIDLDYNYKPFYAAACELYSEWVYFMILLYSRNFLDIIYPQVF